MEVSIIFKIAAVGILVSVLSQILKHSGREEQASQWNSFMADSVSSQSPLRG